MLKEQLLDVANTGTVEPRGWMDYSPTFQQKEANKTVSM